MSVAGFGIGSVEPLGSAPLDPILSQMNPVYTH